MILYKWADPVWLKPTDGQITLNAVFVRAQCVITLHTHTQQKMDEVNVIE